jgi:tRNA-splicing ligase RtcB (3'-phosphate/5'-hydroxy nucleic acid ligase)
VSSVFEPVPETLVPTTVSRSGARVRSLALEDEARDPLIERSIGEMSELPWVDEILALPDVHQKAQMEIPSSIAVTTRDVLVPEFTSAAVNDGMGVVLTQIDAANLTPDRIEAFFTKVNANAAAHPFDGNRYSIDADTLRRVLVEGAAGILDRYELPRSILDAIEDRGVVPDEPVGTLEEIVPFHLLASRFSRCEMGLNFGGNHFLELQVVEKVLDPAAAAWGLKEGQVVVMYHLGPGPFSGTLLHHYSRRTKLKSHRVPMFLLSKLLFHYGQRFGRGNPAQVWSQHFRQNRWTPFAQDSEVGRRFRRALAAALNFGWAYRLGTVRAIFDGLAEAITPHPGATLLCDVAHNGIARERWGGREGWVARHNACRLTPGAPAIVAGSYDVVSYLGIGGNAGDRGLHSYDHGAGNLIEHHRENGTLGEEPGEVVRLKMTRGRNAEIVRRRAVPMRSREPIDHVMAMLERHDVVRPAARLRPVGNFKN